MKFTDLPVDVIVLITPFLPPADFLSLCATCKALYGLQTDSAYWRQLAHESFRLPVRLSDIRGDQFWMKLYQRLRTETKVYLWGGVKHEVRNAAESLGENIFSIPRSPPGFVSDLQIGGWSIILLNNQGQLYLMGQLDGGSFLSHANSKDTPTLLEGNHEPIRQFSTGRTHVIALDDNSSIWQWVDEVQQGSQVDLGLPDYKASRVVAGWTLSSAYLPGWGIAVWAPQTPAPQTRRNNEEPSQQAAVHSPRNYRIFNSDAENGVPSHILLEHLIIFNTTDGKLYVSRYPDLEIDNSPALPSFQLPLDSVTEVQGSFRSLGVFKSDGTILVGYQEQLIEWVERKEQNPYFNDELQWSVIPALQNSGVIQLAFGDWHFHALHSDGSISSYGTESQGCGALGLWGSQGLSLGADVDPKVLPHGYIRGRRVLFHPSQVEFVQAHERGEIPTPRGLGAIRARLLFQGPQGAEQGNPAWQPGQHSLAARGEYSEWVEQMANNWHEWPAVKASNEGGLNPYFAMTVAAGGWGSGAIVLVDERIANKITEEYKNSFARQFMRRIRLELPSGTYNPDAEPVLWKEEPPQYNFEYTGSQLDEVYGISKWRFTT